MGSTPTSYGRANCPPTWRPHWPPTCPARAIIWQKINPRLAWDDQTYLLADIRDSLAFLAWTKTKEASRKGARWRGQLQRPGTVRHEATGGEVMAMDDEQLNAYLAAPRTTIREA